MIISANKIEEIILTIAKDVGCDRIRIKRSTKKKNGCIAEYIFSSLGGDSSTAPIEYTIYSKGIEFNEIDTYRLENVYSYETLVFKAPVLEYLEDLIYSILMTVEMSNGTRPLYVRNTGEGLLLLEKLELLSK